MDAVFHFHFYDHNNDFTPSRSLAFYATNINTTWEELDEKIACCAEDMEAKHGDHCGLVSAGANLIGYSSSDIDAEHQDDVMRAWRTTFLNQFSGCVVSVVFDITHVKDDAQIFEHTKQAYEQQHAERLRAVLNTHIPATTSPAAAKKM